MKKSIFTLLCIFIFVACNLPQEKATDAVKEVFPSVIELVTHDSIPTKDIKQFCVENGMDTTCIYQWENHIILYDTIKNETELMKAISQTLPSASVKFYDYPFYVFDRKNCENTNTAEKWSHTIMTANLVADTILQQEYMNYHVTQAEKWPEVANGFCKAEFQQLLIFRNERQLMLIISIPEGKSLDELNSKTTENNPRVDEWNAIMGKYQEGIPDAEKGNTWVVFDPIFPEKTTPHPAPLP